MTVPPPPAPKPAGKGLSAWFTGHKTQAYIGAAGLVITIALYVKSKDSAAAAGSSTASTAVPTSTADTTGTDAYNGIEDQVLGLQSAFLGLRTGSASPSSTVPAGASISEGLAPGSTISTTPAVASSPALSPAGTTVLPEISSTQAYPADYTFANPSSLGQDPQVQPTSAGGTSYNPPAPPLPAGETSGEYFSIPGDPY